MRLNSNGEVHTSREERISRRAWLQTIPPGNVLHLSTTFRLGYQDSNLRQSAQFRRPPRGERASDRNSRNTRINLPRRFDER